MERCLEIVLNTVSNDDAREYLNGKMSKESILKESFMNKLNKINYTILLMDWAYKVKISGNDYVLNAYSFILL